MNNTEINEQIKTIENKITNTKSALKIWANQISQYHKQLKALSQQLETIKQQTTMNENNNDKLNNNQSTKGGLN